MQQVTTKAFLSWCASQGITLEHLHLVDTDPTNRYLQQKTTSTTTSTTGRGMPLVQVPLKSCLLGSSPEDLAERLASERQLGVQSKFAPYLDILPADPWSSYDDTVSPSSSSSSLLNLPRFWTTQRLERVSAGDGGPLEARLSSFASRMAGISNLDPWALACVNSRANYLPPTRTSLQQHVSYSMTPVLDLFNHNGSVKTSAQIVNSSSLSQQECLQVFVDRTFAVGQEVFLSYGDLTNLETLFDYGFVAADNPWNEESLVTRLIRHDTPIVVTVSAKQGYEINLEALATLRKCLATPAELEQKMQPSSRIDTQTAAFLQPLSKRNEGEVLAFLSAALEDAVTKAQTQANRVASTTGFEKDPLVALYLTERAKTLWKGLRNVEMRLESIV